MKHKIILITGGSGSLGQALTDYLLRKTDWIIRILSRDEYKQHLMAQSFKNQRLRFLIGDVRDADRVDSACNGADYVIHAAAMKQVPACNYNPFEAVKTNILGTQNIISACKSQGVQKLILVSTDKAIEPINLYGATKMVAEQLTLKSNQFGVKASVVRYGNVWGSRGSILEKWKKIANRGIVELTDSRMTRFFITLPEAVQFIFQSLQRMKGGEIFIPEDLPSARMIDIAHFLIPNVKIKNIGIREGEKLHEKLADGYVSNDPARLISGDKLKRFL